MKKILVVNDFPIFPVVHGGKVRIFNIYSNISSQYQVRYVCLGDTQQITTKKISENFFEITVPKTFLYKKMLILAQKLTGSSVDDFVALFFAGFNSQLKKIIIKEIAECDIVFFSHPYMYPAIRPYIREKKVFYEALNIEFTLKQSILTDGLLKKIMLHRLKKISQDLLNRSTLCFTMSEEDKQRFSHVYDVEPSKIRVAPNGVDVDFYSGVFGERTNRKESVIPCPLIIFMGSGHPPNVEAARQIVRNIAPKLPDMYFLIAGSVCWMIHNENLGKNVGVAYMITEDEKRELFRNADIAINPMMSGSGTNLKMLDYMAAGIPVISTPIGARGIDLQNGIHAIICDIDAFPREISRLVDNTDLSKTLSCNSRNLAKDHYDWKKISDSMVSSLEDVINQH